MKDIIINLNYSISKYINSILIKKNKRNKKIINYSCINCGYCANVCPVNLLPQKLYLYSKNNNHEKLKNSYIMDCIECEVCEKVCPSNIPLVKYFKDEKKNQNKLNIEANQKKIFFNRFQEKEKRILNQKNKMYKDKNYFNNISIKNYSVVQKIFKNESINKNQIQNQNRKKILQSAIERVKLKNKNL